MCARALKVQMFKRSPIKDPFGRDKPCDISNNDADRTVHVYALSYIHPLVVRPLRSFERVAKRNKGACVYIREEGR